MRAGELDASVREPATRRLDEILEEFDVVPFSTAIETCALEMLARHGLRTLDALQLACAMALRGGPPYRRAGFVCCDRRLGAAAAAEGIDLVLG